MPDVPLTRRSLLTASGTICAAAAGLTAAPTRSAAAPSAATLPSDPFTLGVASGDVRPDAVVLWTRLSPAPTEPGLGMTGQGPLLVSWQLATTPDGLDHAPLACGRTVALPEHAWSVHVDVAGLRPDRPYFYRFRAEGWTSPVGRTRTAPVPSARRSVRFAVLSCQNLAKPGSGQFYLNGVADIAARDDLDFVLHLGDYIYEFGRAGHIPPAPCVTLEDYRRRYGQYKSLADLRALHARFPVYGVPDDHEFFDNVFGGDPLMTDADRERFSNALQAYWENMPVRGGPPRWDAAARRLHLPLHRYVRWGRELDLLLVDDRQYRTPDSTILGAGQLDWLLAGVAGSHATWTAIGSGVPVSWFPEFPGAGDKWTGYEQDRSRLTDALAARLAARPHRPFNPVVLSGDIHRALVTHVRRRQDAGAELVATEFVGAPTTSNSNVDFARNADTGAFRGQYAYLADGALQAYRGYLDCAVSSTSWTTTYVLGNQIEEPGGTVTPFDRWQLPVDAPVGSVRRL
ncbi:MAG: alkaline phosphatase D family protein [Actinocatenispora sp.]